MTFRWFLLISTFFGYMSIFFALVQLMRKTNPKQVLSVFLVPAFLNLAAGAFHINGGIMICAEVHNRVQITFGGRNVLLIAYRDKMKPIFSS